MKNESAQPFDQTQRDPRDERLVGQVLGPEAAAEMEALTSGQVTSDNGRVTLVLTEAEAAVTENIEQEGTPEQRKLQYIKWAKSFGEGEGWVDNNFIFNKDGTVETEGELDLEYKSIEEWPPNLVRIRGALKANFNKFTTTEGMPGDIDGMIHLGANQIESLEGLPRIINGLAITNNPIESLEGLKGKEVNGQFWMQLCPVDSIPEGLSVNCVIQLFSDQEKLVEDAIEKGYRVNTVSAPT